MLVQLTTSLHRSAARVRFGVNMNGLVWAANGERMVRRRHAERLTTFEV